MAGRPAKPIQLHMSSGNPSHLTHEEIESRKNTEIKFGSSDLKCPAFVKADPHARKKWSEVKALYSGFDFVASGDVGLLGRYCMTWSEYLDLIARRNRIDTISQDCDDVDDYLNEYPDEFNARVRRKLMDMCSTAAVLQIDTAINKKMDELTKMEDRLFLNPLAKLKNVPKTSEKEKEPESKWDKYRKSG